MKDPVKRDTFAPAAQSSQEPKARTSVFGTLLKREETTPPLATPAPPLEEAKERQKTEEPEARKEEKEDEALWGDVDIPVSSQVEGAELALLPPPIDDERSCKKCYVGDACLLYRKVRYVRADEVGSR